MRSRAIMGRLLTVVGLGVLLAIGLLMSGAPASAHTGHAHHGAAVASGQEAHRDAHHHTVPSSVHEGHVRTATVAASGGVDTVRAAVHTDHASHCPPGLAHIQDGAIAVDCPPGHMPDGEDEGCCGVVHCLGMFAGLPVEAPGVTHPYRFSTPAPTLVAIPVGRTGAPEIRPPVIPA